MQFGGPTTSSSISLSMFEKQKGKTSKMKYLPFLLPFLLGMITMAAGGLLAFEIVAYKKMPEFFVTSNQSSSVSSSSSLSLSDEAAGREGSYGSYGSSGIGNPPPSLSPPPKGSSQNDIIIDTKEEKSEYDEFISKSWPMKPFELLVEPQGPEWCNGTTEIFGSVMTSPFKPKARIALRNRYEVQTGGRVRPLFFLGMISADNKELSQEEYLKQIKEEALVTDDIVLGNFTDSYSNLAEKTALILQYVFKCSGIQFSVKNDIDVVVNWSTMIEYLKTEISNGVGTNLYSGFRWTGMPVIHDPKHRNFENISRNTFPPYNSGPCYVLGREAGKKLARQRFQTDMHYVNEDAMLGLLAEASGNMTVSTNKGFIPFSSSGYREPACNGPTSTIAECGCENWISYHCPDKREASIAIDASLACRLRHPTWVDINVPLLSDKPKDNNFLE